MQMQKVMLIFVIFIQGHLYGQTIDSSNNHWQMNGYLKAVETIVFDKSTGSNTSGHLLHNRINIKWKPHQNFLMAGELRNRFFYGEAGSENNHPVLKCAIERVYADYQAGKWSLRVGRQRVNWGIATTWNPNDIFNTYNFLDLDYEERPGTDAVKLEYSCNDWSHLELVHSVNGNKQVSALKYFINRYGYDFQLILGRYQGIPTVGAGWAGNLKDFGFKGEYQQYFDLIDSLRLWNLTVGVDYMFKNGLYMNTGLLLNSKVLHNKIQSGNYLNLQLSAQNLMPAKYNFLFLVKKEINPLLSWGFTAVYSPQIDLLILMPDLKYSLATDWDLDFAWQSIYLNKFNCFQNLSEMGFFRVRWSF